MGLANLALVRVLAEPAQVGAAVDLVRVRVTVRVEVRPRARIEVKVGRRGRPCPSASRRWSSTWPRRPPSLGDTGRYREMWGGTGRYGRARGLAVRHPWEMQGDTGRYGEIQGDMVEHVASPRLTLP